MPNYLQSQLLGQRKSAISEFRLFEALSSVIETESFDLNARQNNFFSEIRIFVEKSDRSSFVLAAARRVSPAAVSVGIAPA